MDIYSMLEKVLKDKADMSTYFFSDEDDVIKTLGGIILCGEVKEKSMYLVYSNDHFCEKCDFVVYAYGDLHFAYLIEYIPF